MVPMSFALAAIMVGLLRLRYFAKVLRDVTEDGVAYLQAWEAILQQEAGEVKRLREVTDMYCRSCKMCSTGSIVQSSSPALRKAKADRWVACWVNLIFSVVTFD